MQQKALAPSEVLSNRYIRLMELTDIHKDLLIVLHSMTEDECFTAEDVLRHLQDLTKKIAVEIGSAIYCEASA